MEEDFESSPHGRHASFLGRCPCPPAPSEVERAEAATATTNKPLSLSNVFKHAKAEQELSSGQTEKRSPLKPLQLPCMPSEYIGNKVDSDTSKRQTPLIRVCGMRSGERQQLQVLSDLRCRIAQSQSIDEPISTQTRIEPEVTFLRSAQSHILHLQRELALKSAEIQRLKMEKRLLAEEEENHQSNGSSLTSTNNANERGDWALGVIPMF
ncbi:hypothetical protein GUITHDRAFT_102534 [Guillardia theta CCMP2712]|uniref:Uncharacterized protein n=1 Tax=Guillardia theta (strain CCMP2712) TaxID=905079 RepID=L1JV13_GUITC|nr:hypothetical protein GUITHDRAFT_102534 [Guillardia theta CCMP2712]EKX51923.1 hypothetical protein GUITHDRAFT_102534 [Guillardia theta CCMP2712]|eukprot:XP_005838903.1 hypothetical protein GUITHDRAFT_102534 [Guillardia theta CCMP2712]